MATGPAPVSDWQTVSGPSDWQTVSGNQPQSAGGSNWAIDPVIGAFKGAASTLFHTGDLIRRGEQSVKGALPKQVQDWLDSAPQGVKDFVGYGSRPLENQDVQQGITPSNTAQKVGKTIEQGAEYAIPGLDAEKGASLAAKAATQAAKFGAVAGAQTGGDTRQMIGAAETGAALPVVGALAGKAMGAVSDLANNMPEGSAGRALKLIPGYDTAKKWLTSLDDVRAGIAKMRGQPEPTPGTVTPAIIKAANESGTLQPGEDADLLNGIAQGMGGKQFDNLDLAGRATVREVASRMAQEPSAPPSAPPAVQSAAGPSTPETPVSAPQPPSAPATEAAAAAAQPVGPQAPAQPSGSGPSNPYEARARSQKAQSLARFLYLGGQGIKPEDAAMMNPQHWEMAAKAAGTTKPSPATAKEAIGELQKLWDTDALAQQLKNSMESTPSQQLSQ